MHKRQTHPLNPQQDQRMLQMCHDFITRFQESQEQRVRERIRQEVADALAQQRARDEDRVYKDERLRRTTTRAQEVRAWATDMAYRRVVDAYDAMPPPNGVLQRLWRNTTRWIDDTQVYVLYYMFSPLITICVSFVEVALG